MPAGIRLLTAIVVIGICGFAAARGFSLVRFSLAMENIDSSQQRTEILDSWSSAPDVASRALQGDLTRPIDPSDQKAADRRRQVLLAIASIKPLSPANWLSLSGLQLITDQPMDQVFDSLELSMLTGPNEGYLMEDRGIYGVSLWERLSPDLKRRVAADLTVSRDSTNDRLRTYVSGQPEQVRNELREALIATGLSPKEIEKQLGL